MQLAGRRDVGSPPAASSRLDDRGYILVVLLIAMAVAAIWMSAALPSWRQQAVREREAELVYRGEQYARAITLYYCKNNGTYPQNIDQLISQHYLRKKYKDPITDEDFVPIGGNMPITGTPGRITPPTPPATAGTPGRGTGPGAATGVAQAGITGVRSSSQETSIRLYNSQQVYSQWAFDAASMFNRMGCVAAMRGAGPGRGGPSGLPPGVNPGARPGGPGTNTGPGTGRGAPQPGRGGPGTGPGRGGELPPIPGPGGIRGGGRGGTSPS